MVKPVPGVMTMLSSLTELLINDTEGYSKMVYYRSTFRLAAFSRPNT